VAGPVQALVPIRRTNLTYLDLQIPYSVMICNAVPVSAQILYTGIVHTKLEAMVDDSLQRAPLKAKCTLFRDANKIFLQYRFRYSNKQFFFPNHKV
jgi:hypothetical protein